MFCFVCAATAQDEPPPSPADVNLNQVYQDGMNAFQVGDYQKAVTNLENLIAQAAQESQLEPAYFTLGAAYFNLKQYPKSIEVFKKYLEKFPKSTRISQAIYSLARASLMSKDYPAAQGYFKQLENDPKMREQILNDEAMAYKEAGQIDEAIAIFEKLTRQEIITTRMANSAILLAELYVKKHDAPKAIALLQRLQKKTALVDNVVRLNSLAVELGDAMIEDQKPDIALSCFRIVRTRADVIKFQSDRIAAMQKKIDQNLETLRSGEDPSDNVALINENNQIRAAMGDENVLLKEFQKLPDFQPALLLCIARCFYNMGEKWEAIVAFDTLLEKYPGVQEREPAMYGALVASAEVGRVRQTRKYCEEYLKSFPHGQSADTVGYLMGATAMQANDPQAAETYFGRMLRERPGSSYREEMQFLLGNVYFGQGKYEEAAAMYAKCQHDFPTGQYYEEAIYRTALCSVFAGTYEPALKLLTAYVAKYPQGAFIADAKYRLAVCNYAAEEYGKVREICEAWKKFYPGNPQLAEVLALEADMYASTDENETAIELYLLSYKAATTDEVLNYSLFEATKLMQKLGQWEEIARVFEEFVKKNPDNPATVSALFWIGKAKARTGHPEEAKKFFADTIKKYIDKPGREAVDQILTQLATLCMKKTAQGTVEAGPGQEVDPGAELDDLLGTTKADQSPTAKARILFAKAELARLRRQTQECEKDLQAIAEKFKPEDLSPEILGQVGDYLFSKGDTEKASQFYEQLKDEYPKSDYVDFAYAGLGEIAFDKKDYKTALEYFTYGTDKITAEQKLKDVTVGRAKTLLELNQFDEARKLFEQAVAVREWRGESTALSLYSLGQIEMKQSKWADANAYFQRVFVGYQKFLPWVAKSYLMSGECFQKLGKIQEAINTYKEMLNNEKLQQLPEAETARQRLKELGAA